MGIDGVAHRDFHNRPSLPTPESSLPMIPGRNFQCSGRFQPGYREHSARSVWIDGSHSGEM